MRTRSLFNKTITLTANLLKNFVTVFTNLTKFYLTKGGLQSDMIDGVRVVNKRGKLQTMPHAHAQIS